MNINNDYNNFESNYAIPINPFDETNTNVTTGDMVAKNEEKTTQTAKKKFIIISLLFYSKFKFLIFSTLSKVLQIFHKFLFLQIYEKKNILAFYILNEVIFYGVVVDVIEMFV